MKPKGRTEWRVVLDICRFLRTFTPTQRQAWRDAGRTIDAWPLDQQRLIASRNPTGHWPVAGTKEGGG